MYNFTLIKDEKVIKIFDEIYICQGENEKTTTIILTNKRLLFLEHRNPNEGLEVLKIARGMNYIQTKDVYFEIDLTEIEVINKNEYYQVKLKNQIIFEFDNDDLYKLLMNK